MRNIFLILTLFIISCAPISVQERKSENIISNLGKNKNELYELTIEWMANTFRDSESVIEVNNRDRGRIVGTGYMTVSKFGASTEVKYTLMISVGNNRIRLQFKDFGYHDNSPIMKSDNWVLVTAKEKGSLMAEGLELYIKNYSNSD